MECDGGENREQHGVGRHAERHFEEILNRYGEDAAGRAGANPEERRAIAASAPIAAVPTSTQTTPRRLILPRESRTNSISAAAAPATPERDIDASSPAIITSSAAPSTSPLSSSADSGSKGWPVRRRD